MSKTLLKAYRDTIDTSTHNRHFQRCLIDLYSDRVLSSVSCTSFGDSASTNCSKIFLAFELILWDDVIFLQSSHFNQNSMFSSLNSDFRKVRNVARPSARQNTVRMKTSTSLIYSCFSLLWPQQSHAKNSSEKDLHLELRSRSKDWDHCWVSSKLSLLRSDGFDQLTITGLEAITLV